MRLAALQVLAESAIRQIHEASLSLLETCSHEQLLMDEEIAGMCRRLAQGVEVA